MTKLPYAILAIDTSAGTCVARIDGTQSRSASDPNSRGHAENLAPLIESVGGSAGIDAVVVGTGPAPFTGLRVGIITARVLADTLGVPGYGICVLDALARQAFDRTDAREVTVVSDARRREIYTASYQRNGADDVTYLSRPQVLAPVDLIGRGIIVGATDLVAGPVPVAQHTSKIQDQSPSRLPLQLDVTVFARLLAARLTAGIELPTTPQYLREPDIHRG